MKYNFNDLGYLLNHTLVVWLPIFQRDNITIDTR